MSSGTHPNTKRSCWSPRTVSSGDGPRPWVRRSWGRNGCSSAWAEISIRCTEMDALPPDPVTVDPLFDPAVVEEPYGYYARLQKRDPVHEVEGTGAYLVTRLD